MNFIAQSTTINASSPFKESRICRLHWSCFSALRTCFDCESQYHQHCSVQRPYSDWHISYRPLCIDYGMQSWNTTCSPDASSEVLYTNPFTAPTRSSSSIIWRKFLKPSAPSAAVSSRRRNGNAFLVLTTSWIYFSVQIHSLCNGPCTD